MAVTLVSSLVDVTGGDDGAQINTHTRTHTLTHTYTGGGDGIFEGTCHGAATPCL